MKINTVESKQIIEQLKEVRTLKKLSFQDIISMMEENGDYISKTTLSRVFSEGSEDINFKYEDTIRPIANALLDINNLEDDDTLDIRTMKTILRYKMQRIEELERQVELLENKIDKEKIKYHKKIDKEREAHQRSIEFLKNQIELKDKRMDQLLDAVFHKDQEMNRLLDRILNCNCRVSTE